MGCLTSGRDRLTNHASWAVGVEGAEAEQRQIQATGTLPNPEPSNPEPLHPTP